MTRNQKEPEDWIAKLKTPLRILDHKDLDALAERVATEPSGSARASTVRAIKSERKRRSAIVFESQPVYRVCGGQEGGVGPIEAIGRSYRRGRWNGQQRITLRRR